MSYYQVLDRLEDMGRLGPRDVEYLGIIGPGESQQMLRDMTRMSTCALFVSGVWVLSGLQDPALEPPYRIGTAVSRIVEVARRRGWILPVPDPIAWYRGDVVIVARPEHCMIILEGGRERSSAIRTIEGGDGMRCMLRQASVLRVDRRRILYFIRPIGIGDVT